MLWRLLTSLAMIVMLGTSAHAYSYFWTVYQKADGLPDNDVEALAVDPGGYVWLATRASLPGGGGGVAVLDPAGMFIPQYESSEVAVSGFAFEPVLGESLANANVGALWIATSQGMQVLDRKGVLTTLKPENSPLPGNSATAVFISSENTKWISVAGRGVCCIDSSFNWSSYTPAEGLCSQEIVTIQEDRNGNIWMGSNGKGACCLEREGAWLQFSSTNSGLISDEVRQIVAEPPNRLWFVTPSGVSVFNGQNWTSYTARNSPLGDFRPTAMAVDGSGNKWIGTERGGLFKLDSFGMWTTFHRDNSSLPDNRVKALAIDQRGTVWVATSAGLCSIATAPQATRHPLPIDAAHGMQAHFEHALIWENIGEADVTSEVSFALPAFFQGARSWLYAAFWPDQDFSFSNLQYSITGNRRGNQKITLSGRFARTVFLACGGMQGMPGGLVPDRRMSYPFPASYPEEVQEYLMPGDQLPSNNPEVLNLAQSLVRPESKTDMYQTVLSILYSKIIQNLGLEARSIGLLRQQEAGEEDATVGAVQDVHTVLRNRRGDQHARARLFCTLARAAGIPARLVMSMQGTVWSQVWIAGMGWVAVDMAHPVYDYVRPWRTYMPKLLGAEEYGISAVSGRDDDVGFVLWPASIKAYYTETSPKDLNNPRQIAAAKILLLKIGADENIPAQARMPIDVDTFVIARQQEDSVVLLFLDSAGKELQRTTLAFDGLACTINVRDRIFWKCVPRRIGDMLIIESLGYQTAQTTVSP